MHRCGSGFLLTLAIIFVAAFSGCLGKNTANTGDAGVQSVTLSPSGNLSLDVGSTQFFSASGKDASGRVVLPVEIQYLVSVPQGSTNSAPLSITSSGNACAGTWDATGGMCSPGLPGIAVVTAVINGVSSPPATVYVHQHIDNLQIGNAESLPPRYDCFSQGQTWLYQATAYNHGVDITSSVGYMNWSSSNTAVVGTSTNVAGLVPPLEPNQVQVTAKAPGITQLYASVGGVTSSPLPFTTCLVQAIYLQIGGQNQAGNSFTVNSGGSIPVSAIAVDTLYPLTGIPMKSPPLTWSTSNPEVAAFTTTTNSTGSNSATARNNLGGASLTASCTPPSCNIGVLPSLPIYARNCSPTSTPACELPNGTNAYDAISVDVTLSAGGTLPTYGAWAATTDCQNASGCTSALFAISPTITPIGSILTLPRTPNSMMFNHATSPRLYIGSDQGLMYVDVSGTNVQVNSVSSVTTPCYTALCGKLLTVSNDGKLAVVSDTVSTPHQVYIYNGGSASTAPIDLVLPGESATAAAFSPDQLKLFIVTDTGNLYVYSTVDALTSVPIATSVTDVKFSANGSFAYVAGTPNATSVSAFANCNTPTTSILNGVTTTAVPLSLFPLPTQQLDSNGNWAEVVLAVDPPYIDTFGVTVQQSVLPDGDFLCFAPSVELDSDFRTSANLGQGKFTPLYSQLVNDGTQVILVAQNVPAVLIFNVSLSGNSGTTTSIPLAGSAETGCTQCTGTSWPLAASASNDGSQIYVAACDVYPNNDPTQPCSAGSVHIVSTVGGEGDYQQVPYINLNQDGNTNMCNSLGPNAPLCLPNLVAIRPQ
ncbi:MAG: hypothetical protein WCF68_04630 [Terriglobales bacterium]